MLHKDTYEFLESLKENNNREWFTENKAWYERGKSDFESLVSEIINGIAAFDSQIGHPEAKRCVFRIYRDIRFSPDKTPYKTHFGAVIRPQGLDKSSGYYIHISPEESFVSCGHYMLRPDQIKKVRKGIYDDFEMFSSILNEKHFKKEIGDLFRDEDALQRVPNGFDKEHPAAEYMKLKHFYAVKDIPQKKFFEKDIAEYIVSIYKQMYPLNEFLNDLLLD
jgi:uncharacterized protein (TIGR02453 family)